MWEHHEHPGIGDIVDDNIYSQFDTTFPLGTTIYIHPAWKKKSLTSTKDQEIVSNYGIRLKV